MSDHVRIAQLDGQDGEDVAYVTMSRSVYDGLSEDEKKRVRLIEEGDKSGESPNPLNQYRRPREATFPKAPEVAGEPVNPGYEAKKRDQLEAEITTRNEGRPEGEQIVVAPPGNKPELVAALEADDKPAQV